MFFEAETKFSRKFISSRFKTFICWIKKYIYEYFKKKELFLKILQKILFKNLQFNYKQTLKFLRKLIIKKNPN